MKEQIILDGLEQRDKIAFDFLFNYYYSSLCAFAFSFIQNRDVAEDVVQDFFVSLWIYPPQLKNTSSLRSYLFTSVKNRCLDYQKHHKVIEKHRHFILSSSKEEIDSAENILVESELRQAIQKSLVKLPPRCRQIFENSRLYGLSNQEISDKLGISKRTVELQISNALKILRQELAAFLPSFILIWLIG